MYQLPYLVHSSLYFLLLQKKTEIPPYHCSYCFPMVLILQGKQRRKRRHTDRGYTPKYISTSSIIKIQVTDRIYSDPHINACLTPILPPNPSAEHLSHLQEPLLQPYNFPSLRKEASHHPCSLFFNREKAVCMVYST